MLRMLPLLPIGRPQPRLASLRGPPRPGAEGRGRQAELGKAREVPTSHEATQVNVQCNVYLKFAQFR